MARGINKVTLVGNLGQDPEVKHLSNGNAVANFTIATSENWKDKQTGESQHLIYLQLHRQILTTTFLFN